jgi:hypothetical protein
MEQLAILTTVSSEMFLNHLFEWECSFTSVSIWVNLALVFPVRSPSSSWRVLKCKASIRLLYVILLAVRVNRNIEFHRHCFLT